MTESRKRWTRVLYVGIMLVSVLFFFGQSVSADMGPKPSITVNLTNPPSGTYYVDILWKEDSGSWKTVADEKDQYNPDMLAKLVNYNVDGWHARLYGSPVQDAAFGVSTTRYTVSYMGVPDAYKVIVVTEDLRVIVSPEIRKAAFDEQISFDCETGVVSQTTIAERYAIQFFTTLIPTLVIELLLFIPFGMDFKKNWLKVVLVNLATQILLTIALGWALTNISMMFALFIYIPVEVVILILEMIAYLFLLRKYPKLTVIGYTFAANALSFIGGGILVFVSAAMLG